MRALACLLMCLCASVTSVADWIEIESSNFIVYSQRSEKKTLQLIKELEHFHQFFEGVVSVKPNPGILKLKVYLIKDKRTYGRITQMPKSAGLFGLHRDGPRSILYYNPKDGTFAQSTLQVLLHEYVHWFQYVGGPRNIPLWYREGFAEYVSSSRKTKNGMQLGDVLAARLPSLHRRKWYSLSTLLAATETPSRGDVFYGQSWLLTHMLYAEQDLANNRAKFINLLATGVAPEEASLQAFNVELPELGKRLRRYFRAGKLYAYLFPLGDLKYDVTAASSLTDKEAEQLENSLRLSVVNNEEKRIKVDKRITKLERDGMSPAAVTAARLQLLIEATDFKQIDWPKAVSRAHQALKDYPANPRINALAADLIMRQKKPLGDRNLDTVVKALKKAVEHDPGDAMSRYWLAEAYKRLKIDNVSLILSAYRLYPQYRSIQYQLGAALVEHKQYEKACIVLGALHRSERNRRTKRSLAKTIGKVPNCEL